MKYYKSSKYFGAKKVTFLMDSKEKAALFTDELRDSYLYLKQVSENETTTQYTLKWVIRDFNRISMNKTFSCHYIRIGNEIYRLRILKFESITEEPRERKLFYLFLGITPLPSLADVTISIIGKKNPEIEADNIRRKYGPNYRRRCFFEFKKSTISLENDADLIAMCNIFVNDPHIKVSVGLKKNMLANFEHIYDNKLFSDMIICVGKKLFNAHRLVLTARSPVFEAMFQNKMKENSENKLVIEDSDEETFRELLRYFYIGEIGPLTADLALNLLVLADKYDVSGLKAEITDYLKCEISTKNALSILTEAHLHNVKELEDEAIIFVGNNLQELMNSSKWKEFRLHLDLVDSILSYMCWQIL